MRWLSTFFLSAALVAATDPSELARHAEQAKTAQQRGDFRKAAAEWETIARLQPGVPEVYSNVGMMWHFAKDYAKAIPAFQQAIQGSTKLTAPHLFLGIDFYLTSLPRKALPELQETLSLEPQNALARKWLGMTYFELADFFSAARELGIACRQAPDDPELLFWLSRTHLKLLFASYARIKELSPDSAYLGSVRETSTNISANVNEDALPSLQRALKVHPSDVEIWFGLGSTAKAVALQQLNAFLERAPDSYRVPQLQAEFALASGNEDRAIELYRKSIAMNPQAVQLHFDIANLHLSRHQYSDAIAEYEAELHNDPYSLIALERIGEAYAESNDPARAETYLKRALAIDPQAFDALRVLGKVDFERGDYKGAIANDLAAISATANPPGPLLFQLSRAYRKSGNTEEADRWLARFQAQLAAEQTAVQKHLEEGAKKP